MLKNQLISVVAKNSGVPRDAVRKVLDAAASASMEAAALGDDVYLFGLGKLTVTQRGSKVARNIHTGEKVIVPPRAAVLFKPSVGLIGAVNGR